MSCLSRPFGRTPIVDARRRIGNRRYSSGTALARADCVVGELVRVAAAREEGEGLGTICLGVEAPALLREKGDGPSHLGFMIAGDRRFDLLVADRLRPQ